MASYIKYAKISCCNNFSKLFFVFLVNPNLDLFMIMFSNFNLNVPPFCASFKSMK